MEKIKKSNQGPIIDEIHQIRADLLKECKGDMRRLSLAARKDAEHLGLKIIESKRIARRAKLPHTKRRKRRSVA